MNTIKQNGNERLFHLISEATSDNDDDVWVTEEEWSETEEIQMRNTVSELRIENERLKSALNQSSSVPNPLSVGWCPTGSNPTP